jgi:hypothetical protein
MICTFTGMSGVACLSRHSAYLPGSATRRPFQLKHASRDYTEGPPEKLHHGIVGIGSGRLWTTLFMTKVELSRRTLGSADRLSS